MARTTIADVSKTVAVLEERIEAIQGKLSDTATAVGQLAEYRQEDRVAVSLLGETAKDASKSIVTLQTQLAASESARRADLIELTRLRETVAGFADLRVTVGKLAEQQRADHVELVRLREELVTVRKDSADATAKATDLGKENADLKQELAVLGQRLAEHLKRVEVQDARRWGLITLMAGAVMSLASGLVVALARR